MVTEIESQMKIIEAQKRIDGEQAKKKDTQLQS